MIEKELRALGATFQIEQISGQGGSASVYKAYRLDSDGYSRQTVALKILKNKNAIPWLKKEFETLTQIRSVHCAQVYAWETLALGPALMMEWIEGVTLFEFARGSSFKTHLLSEIVAQVEAGLRELAVLELHHGDLSPKNILIDRTGLVRLVDFATANAKPGKIVGTPAYLSPEIWEGSGTSLKSDLFALRLIESDALQSFQNVPATPNECQQRAFASKSSRCQMTSAASSARLREELASAVNRHLDTNFEMCATTRVQEISSRTTKPWPLVSHVASLIGVIGFGLMLVTAGAQAPIPSPALEKTSSLKVASNRWIFVSLNGKNAGYAPLHLKNLHAGHHRFVWTTSAGQKETRIKLEPGQTLMLTERELSRLE